MQRENYRNKNNLERANSAMNFGELLSSTRKKHGISISEVASELHVREDIVEALENCDFAKIPPQGYSRNMIRSYSRLLGLNANRVTNMFLDSEYTYQVEKKRSSVQKLSNENKKRVPETIPLRKSFVTPREQIETQRVKNRELDKGINKNEPINDSPFEGRTMHSYRNKYKNTPRARGSFDDNLDLNSVKNPRTKTRNFTRDLAEDPDYDTAKARLEARMQNRANKGIESGFKEKQTYFNGLKKRNVLSRNESNKLNNNEDPNFIPEQTEPSKSGSYQFMNIYNKKTPNTQSKLAIPIIVAAVVVLVILLILVFFFVGKTHENDKADVSNLNVVGISDIENQGNQEKESKEKQNVEAPKEVEFKYTVKDSSPVYMEIYEGASSKPVLAREVKPGESNTFKVADTLKFVTTRPSAVEISVNNEVVTPKDSGGNGIYTYTVDFKSYLDQWKAKHPDAKQ